MIDEILCKSFYIHSPQPCLKDELLCKLSEPVRDSRNKITIVGAGMVGVACATSILTQVKILQKLRFTIKSLIVNFDPLKIAISKLKIM